MSDPNVDIPALAAALEGAPALKTIKTALETFGEHISISFSGAEDVLLIEYAKQTGLPFRVFSLDTGRLHAETYAFMDAVEKHYDLRIEICFPEREAVEALVRGKGLFSFYEDGHGECCGIRKVEPLRRQLAGLDAWITGQRRDQSPGTRSDVEVVERDDAFEGRGGETRPLIKFNPLAHMTSAEVWQAIEVFEVPHNPLHDRGLRSIGCAPCTRATLPHEHERSGRWWWEEATKKECGLHMATDAVSSLGPPGEDA